jgi:hypothetical protein
MPLINICDIAIPKKREKMVREVIKHWKLD